MRGPCPDRAPRPQVRPGSETARAGTGHRSLPAAARGSGPARLCCSIAGALRDTLCSEPFLASLPCGTATFAGQKRSQHRDPAGVAAPCPSGVFAARRCPGAVLVPLWHRVLGQAGLPMGRAQPTHPAQRLLRVSAELFRLVLLHQQHPPGDAGVRWRSAWPLSDWASEAFPVLFGGLFVLSDGFSCG